MVRWEIVYKSWKKFKKNCLKKAAVWNASLNNIQRTNIVIHMFNYLIGIIIVEQKMPSDDAKNLQINKTF